MKDQLRNQRVMLLVSLLSLTSFLFLTLSKSSLLPLDANVNYWAVSIQTSSLTTTALIIDFVFDTPALLVITLLVTAFLFYKHYRKESVLLAGAMLLDAIIIEVIKITIRMERPLNELIYAPGFSYPSGHTSGSVVFCGVLIYYAWRHWSSLKVKISSFVLYVIATSTVGFDRVYLNVHWFSDVLGGCLLGVFLLTISIFTFQNLVLTTRARKIE